MKIGIIDYGTGNVRSVKFAIERLGYSAELLSDVSELDKCDKIIFPGVGHAKPAMEKLREKGLDKYILNCQKPLLGICLGMQLLCKYTEEGDTNCIGVFDVSVLKFELKGLKVPHVGWNTITNARSALFQSNAMENTFVYFVHSYYVPQNKFSIANCTYGIEFSAALNKDNFYATQFHPEKSGGVGEKILNRFIAL
jgi:imidazole glycerol-phosphate synthase subunit HisH